MQRPAAINHLPYLQRCSRLLLCSHECRQPCNEHNSADGGVGTACPPCNRPCEVACVHTRCSCKCSTPCAACAETCSWECKHQVECPPTRSNTQHPYQCFKAAANFWYNTDLGEKPLCSDD